MFIDTLSRSCLHVLDVEALDRLCADPQLQHYLYCTSDHCTVQPGPSLIDWLVNWLIVLGTEALDQLCADPQLQHYLHCSSDQSTTQPGCHGSPGGASNDVKVMTEQRLSRITRDIQRRVKQVQDDETVFRSPATLYSTHFPFPDKMQTLYQRWFNCCRFGWNNVCISAST